MQAQEDGARKAEGGCWGQRGQGGEKEKEEVSVMSFGLLFSTLHFDHVCIHTSASPPCLRPVSICCVP